MAEEIRIVRVDGEGEREDRGERRVEHVEPTSTEDARRAVEETRGRISATIDAIEDRLDTKREELKEKLNVLRPVREQIRSHHWRSLGVAFGAGVLLSTLFGGEEEEEKGERKERRRGRGLETLDESEREALREWRAERKERLARLKARSRMREHRENGMGFGRIGRTLVSAVVEGLGDRMRRQAR